MFYLTNYILIRKEHFGTVIFLPSLQKYVIDNKFFKLFPYFKKGTDFPPLLRNFSSFSKNELSYFIQSLLKYRILITKKNIPSTIRIITNKFVSKDCLSFPRAVYLECTNRCNYNCIFCYQGEKLEKKDFDLFLLRKLTKEMKRYGTSFVSIGGGEPLLYPFLFQAIQEIQEKGIQTEIVTNGSLFNKTNIKQLKATGLRFVQVSLDSSNEKTYLILRKGGNFKKVIKNIEMLAKEGFEVCISMVLTKLNFKEIDKVIELSKKLGAARFRIIHLREIGRAKKLSSLQLNGTELQTIYRYLIEKRKKEKKIKIVFNPNLIIPLVENIKWIPKSHYGCIAGRSICGIDPVGDVYPCPFLKSKELKCGNITNESLKKIWENSFVLKKIRNIKKLEGKCKKCNFLKICKGGCRNLAYFKRNRINDSNFLCSVGKRINEKLLKKISPEFRFQTTKENVVENLRNFIENGNKFLSKYESYEILPCFD